MKKRSNKPIFWSLFGAGGMLSALIGPMLVLLVGVAVPLGWVSANALSYDRVLAFARSFVGGAALVVVIALFLFHGMHRLYHTLHDFGVHVTPGVKAICHGLAAAGTMVAITLLFLLPR